MEILSSSNTIFRFKPSQYYNIYKFILWVAFASVLLYFFDFFTEFPSRGMNIIEYTVISVFSFYTLYLIYVFLDTHLTVWEINEECLYYHHGVFNRYKDHCELFRVLDYREMKTWYLRPFGLTSFIIHTSDVTHPVIKMYALTGIDGFDRAFRNLVLKAREHYHVRTYE